MAEVFGAMISDDLLIIIGSFFLFGLVLIYFYRHSNKKLMKKIRELKHKDREIYKLIERVNKARIREHKEVTRKLHLLEKKVNIALKPEGHEKELEKEKIRL